MAYGQSDFIDRYNFPYFLLILTVFAQFQQMGILSKKGQHYEFQNEVCVWQQWVLWMSITHLVPWHQSWLPEGRTSPLPFVLSVTEWLLGSYRHICAGAFIWYHCNSRAKSGLGRISVLVHAAGDLLWSSNRRCLLSESTGNTQKLN